MAKTREPAVADPEVKSSKSSKKRKLSDVETIVSQEVDEKAARKKAKQEAKEAKEAKKAKKAVKIEKSQDEPMIDSDPVAKSETLVENRNKKSSKKEKKSKEAKTENVSDEKSSKPSKKEKKSKKVKTEEASEKPSVVETKAATEKPSKKEKKSKKVNTEEASEETPVKVETEEASEKPSREKKAKKVKTGEASEDKAVKKDKKEKKSKNDKKVEPKTEEADAEKVDEANGPAKREKFICFIGNLPFTATSDDIQKHFSALKPTSVRLLTQKEAPTKSRGVAFVEFGDFAHMKTCLSKFHHTEFSDGKSDPRKINVELTAGGGGKTAHRQDKIKEKNHKLNEQRTRRIQAEEEAKKNKPAGDNAKPAVEVEQEDYVHPSRRMIVPGRRA